MIADVLNRANLPLGLSYKDGPWITPVNAPRPLELRSTEPVAPSLIKSRIVLVETIVSKDEALTMSPPGDVTDSIAGAELRAELRDELVDEKRNSISIEPTVTEKAPHKNAFDIQTTRGLELPSAEDMGTLRRVPNHIPLKLFSIAFIELCERFSYYGCTVVCKSSCPTLQPLRQTKADHSSSHQLHPAASSRWFYHWCYCQLR